MTYEATLDPHYICPSWETPKEEQQEKLADGVAGRGRGCRPVRPIRNNRRVRRAEGLRRQDHQGPQHREAASRFGIKTDAQVLTESEKKGREKTAGHRGGPGRRRYGLGLAVKLQHDQRHGEAGGRVLPRRDERRKPELGFCDETGVYIAEDQASGVTKMVLKTALEEVAHWVTGATDASRDFQDFLLRLVVEVAS